MNEGVGEKVSSGLTVGVDVGGTKIAAGVVDEKGVIVDRNRRDTPSAEPDAILAEIIAAAADLVRRHEVTAVGVGAAAFVDAARSSVLFAPNLVWRDTPVRDRVSDGVGLPVVVENDANAAAWGEFQFGAGRDFDDMVALTVGTGVGGGIVAGGELYRGGHGVGGEIGHMLLVRDGQLCGCGLRGCFEAYASGTALVREARSAVAVELPEADHLRDVAGGDPDAVTGPMVTQAANAGDSLSVRLLTQIGTWLGEGMGSLVSVLDPETYTNRPYP